jgi:hypothetical protein
MPSQSKKLWARLLASEIGGKPSVAAYLDDSESTSIDVLTINSGGGKVCATIGLMDSRHEPSVEILMDSNSEDIKLENIISMVSFYIIKNGWRIKPGIIFENLVAEYHPELLLKHLLFLPQFQWGPELSKAILPQGNIYPLLAVPITTAESDYIAKNGLTSLEELWQKNGINVLNWFRESSV